MVKSLLITALLVALALAGCSKNEKGESMAIFKARQIKMQQLPSVLDELVHNQLEFDFFGVTSNGVDCIYFMPESGKIDFDFEAMIKEQIPYIEKLRAYAASKGYSVVDTTYGNKPEYDPSSNAPVIRIKTQATIEDAASIGERILKDVFGCSDSTIFEVVP